MLFFSSPMFLRLSFSTWASFLIFYMVWFGSSLSFLPISPFSIYWLMLDHPPLNTIGKGKVMLVYWERTIVFLKCDPRHCIPWKKKWQGHLSSVSSERHSGFAGLRLWTLKYRTPDQNFCPKHATCVTQITSDMGHGQVWVWVQRFQNAILKNI